MKQQLSLFIAFARIIFAAGNEPCTTNNFIDDWKRSAAYIPENPFCDSFLYEDWYRVTSRAGEKMPTECLVGGWRCGTLYPIWLSGDNVPRDQNLYPAVNETVDRVAYAVVYDNCIARSYNIRIKNCTNYYVYYLRPSIGCPSAYCFGTELPCPPGKNSETGFSPNCGAFPTVTVSPKISVSMHEEIKTNANGTAKIFYSPKFSCTADDATDQYTYDIRYYINDVEIDSATHLNVSLRYISKSVLLQEHWDRVFKPNMMVKCSIQVRADGFESPGHKNFSEQYFAGIRVPGGEHGFIVKEGKGLKIPLEVTLPIGCSHTVDNQRADIIKDKDCFVNLLSAIPKYQVDKCINGLNTNSLEFVTQECSKNISHANWNNNTHFIEVRGESDLKINLKDRITFLRLWTDPQHSSLSQRYLDFWHDVHLPDIKIHIIDTDELSLGHSCYSHNDPHMRLFDGRHWELQNTFQEPSEGEYIMYKHDRLPQQINAFFRKCNIFGMALCNCGVAVRSGESIFVANFCETVSKLGQRRVNRYAASWLCDDQHLVVQETGNHYKVSLPSGTTVEFSHGPVYDFYGIHAIDIRPSQLDYDLTSGLCGRYNKIETDDYVDRVTNLALTDHWEFAKSWRVDAASGESLFDPTKKLPEIMYYLQEYCICHKDKDQLINKCFSSKAMEKCRNMQSTTSVYHASCRSSNFRTKRDLSIQNDEDHKPPMFPMELEPNADQQGSKEPLNWRNGLTADIARAKCQEAFVKSTALSPCTEYVPTVNSEDYVKECIEDMKILGDDSFLKVTLETFASSCLAAASRMENLTNTNSSEELSDKNSDNGINSLQKSIFQIIEESTCPANCSGKGICKSGVCKCNENFFGVDCSKEKSRAPILEKAAFEGICDTSKRPCRKYVIPGLDFYPSNLTCKFRAYEVIQNGSSSELKESTEIFTHPGVYSSLFLVYCDIPESRRRRSLMASDVIATGFYISLSNDGLNFTEELTVMAFDSRCYDCNMTTLSCEIQFEDDCPYKVVVVRSDSDGSKYIGTGIGISIGLALVVGLAIVMALCIRKKMIRKNRYDVKEQSKPEKELHGTNYYIYDANLKKEDC